MSASIGLALAAFAGSWAGSMYWPLTQHIRNHIDLILQQQRETTGTVMTCGKCGKEFRGVR